ncbi:hypothetical protein RRG08_045041 [Elysia crispata]|uniref:Uncharacterized protein n=1 Tax=Elysia crispata TaxID=231223 RepID=A0AAE0XTU8_9GAST|nr:hypothetical protein RRG08_045041 [Elysia crispata]
MIYSTIRDTHGNKKKYMRKRCRLLYALDYLPVAGTITEALLLNGLVRELTFLLRFLRIPRFPPRTRFELYHGVVYCAFFAFPLLEVRFK